MHLLGLNWQLQPADGHTFNNGIRTGLPGSDDVATMPSGGKGEVTVAACPLEVTGKVRAPPPPGSGFLIQILEGMQKKEKRGGKRTALSRCPCSKLSAVPVCELGLAGAAGSWQGAGSELCAYLSYLQRPALQLLESISRPGQQQQQTAAAGAAAAAPAGGSPA